MVNYSSNEILKALEGFQLLYKNAKSKRANAQDALFAAKLLLCTVKPALGVHALRLVFLYIQSWLRIEIQLAGLRITNPVHTQQLVRSAVDQIRLAGLVYHAKQYSDIRPELELFVEFYLHELYLLKNLQYSAGQILQAKSVDQAISNLDWELNKEGYALRMP